MNFLTKIYAWILKNYVKAISFLVIIGLAYGIYLYFFFIAQKKIKKQEIYFLIFIIPIRHLISMNKIIKLLQIKFPK